MIALKVDAKCERKLTCTFKNGRNLSNFQRLKNSDFILQSKISELNKNKKSKLADRPEPVQKHYFTLGINE